MAWSTPLTAVANAALNAAQWNASVRDNLNETAVAKATTPSAGTGKWFVSESTNLIRERVIDEDTVATSQTLGTASSYLSLATNGPILSTVTTGIAALVHVSADVANSVISTDNFVCAEVTGATTMVAADARALRTHQYVAGATRLHRRSVTNLLSLTAGSNTFRVLYKVSAITGTFANRNLIVMPLCPGQHRHLHSTIRCLL